MEVWAQNLVLRERGSNPGPPTCEADVISFAPLPRSLVSLFGTKKK